MPRGSLTKKQQDVLDFLCHFQQENGYPPSYKEIATHFSFSSDGTVRTYLEHLEAKHYIKRSGKARSFQILVDSAKIPILGNIQAGQPIEAIASDQRSIHDLSLFQHKDSKFALNVKGDSMQNAGILDGDIAIIDKNKHFKSGDIIAAMLENEVTLKRYVITKTHIELKSENKQYKPIIVNNSDKESVILGKFVGLVRNSD